MRKVLLGLACALWAGSAAAGPHRIVPVEAPGAGGTLAPLISVSGQQEVSVSGDLSLAPALLPSQTILPPALPSGDAPAVAATIVPDAPLPALSADRAAPISPPTQVQLREPGAPGSGLGAATPSDPGEGSPQKLGARLDQTREEFADAARGGYATVLALSQSVFHGGARTGAAAGLITREETEAPPDDVPEESAPRPLVGTRVNGERMKAEILRQLALVTPAGRAPTRIDLVPIDGPNPFDYDFERNVMRLGVDRGGRVPLGAALHEAQHAYDLLTGQVTREQALDAGWAAFALERAQRNLDDRPKHVSAERAEAEFEQALTRYHASVAERPAFLRQYSAEFDALSTRLLRLEAWLSARYKGGYALWPKVVKAIYDRARDSLDAYSDYLEYFAAIEAPADLPPVAERYGPKRSLKHIPVPSDPLLSKREAIARVGFHPGWHSGPLLSSEGRDEDSTVRRIPEKKAVVKVFHHSWSLRDVFPGLSPAVRSLQNELFTRQFIRLFLGDELDTPRAVGYVDGWIWRKGVLVMEDVGGRVDASKLTALPMRKRILYALAMLVTGGEDTNSNNAHFHDGKDRFEKGNPVILDFARALTESLPSESGITGVTPWVDTNHYNVLDAESRAAIEEFRARLKDPKNLSALKGILRGLGIRGERRRETLRLLLKNADNVELVLESHMRGANRVFLDKVKDSELDARLAGVVSEMNRIVLISPHGGRYRDVVRFLLEMHGYSRDVWIKVPSSHRYVLHPYELALLVRHLRSSGGQIPASDLAEALAYARAGRWPGGPVSEEDLKEDFRQINRWLASPPPLPQAPRELKKAG